MSNFPSKFSHYFFPLYLLDMWMILDVEDLPPFKQVIVEGTLEFEYQNKTDDPEDFYDFSLVCDHLIISGGRVIVGWEDKPFLGTAEIVLRGDHFSPAYPIQVRKEWDKNIKILCKF